MTTITTNQYCTFHLGDVLLGIDVMSVQEVLLKAEITPMPLVNHTVTGLINLRGQIVTAIDLRRRLGMPPREGEGESMHVVVHCGNGVFSLLVDAIGDVITVDPSSYEEPPQTLHGIARDVTKGVFQLDGALLLALDPDRATTLADKPFSDKMLSNRPLSNKTTSEETNR